MAMTRANRRRLVFYSAAFLVAVALIALAVEARARKKQDLIGTLQNGGELMAKLGLYDRAEENARRILKMDPANLYARLLLALACQGTGRFQESIQEYQEARRLTDSPEQRRYIELVMADVARTGKDYEGARRRLDAYRKSHGDDPRALLVRGHLHADLGDSTAAAVCFRRAAEAAPPARGARLALARTYLRLGDKRKALEAFEAVASRGERVRGLWYTVAALRRDLGDRDGARSALRSALALEPKATRRRLRQDAKAWGDLIEAAGARPAAAEG